MTSTSAAPSCDFSATPETPRPRRQRQELRSGVPRVQQDVFDMSVAHHVAGAVDGVAPTCEGVEQGDVGAALRLVTDVHLDHTDPIGKRRQHRRETLHDDLVVVHQRDRDRLPSGEHVVGLPCPARPNGVAGRTASTNVPRRRRDIVLGDAIRTRQPTSVDNDHFEVIVPLETRYASTVRMIAASLGRGRRIHRRRDRRRPARARRGLLDARRAPRRRSGAHDVPPRRQPVDRRIQPGIRARSMSSPTSLPANILRSVVDRYEFTPDGVTLTKRASEG